MRWTDGYIRRSLRAEALRYPGATETVTPRGRSYQVDGKTFAILGPDDAPIALTAQLPESAVVVLTLPNVQPAPGARGRARWVIARYERSRDAPLDLLLTWMNESYEANASKQRIAEHERARLEPREIEEPEFDSDPAFRDLVARTQSRRAKGRTPKARSRAKAPAPRPEDLPF